LHSPWTRAGRTATRPGPRATHGSRAAQR
jgi:hypothetical protein